jgi:hypothetical protein
MQKIAQNRPHRRVSSHGWEWWEWTNHRF